MSLMNSMLMRIMGGNKQQDQQQQEVSPFDKYKADAANNPFGQSSSDQFVNRLLNGGGQQQPQYNLNSSMPLSSMGGFTMPTQQPQFRVQGANNYTYLRGLQ